MKLSEFKSLLDPLDSLTFLTPEGGRVPAHFHITELGLSTKHFIDCGGKERKEQKATMQLWSSVDHDHRLAPAKVIGIIEKTASLFQGLDPEVEVEYQQGTIGRFGLDFNTDSFHLTALHTDCLAKEGCGVPELEAVGSQDSMNSDQACAPGSGCC